MGLGDVRFDISPPTNVGMSALKKGRECEFVAEPIGK